MVTWMATDSFNVYTVLSGNRRTESPNYTSMNLGTVSLVSIIYTSDEPHVQDAMTGKQQHCLLITSLVCGNGLVPFHHCTRSLRADGHKGTN